MKKTLSGMADDRGFEALNALGERVHVVRIIQENSRKFIRQQLLKLNIFLKSPGLIKFLSGALQELIGLAALGERKIKPRILYLRRVPKGERIKCQPENFAEEKRLVFARADIL